MPDNLTAELTGGTVPTDPADDDLADDDLADDDLADDVLVEEVSIDGMCGVY
jgi:mycofactocin precursor